RTGKALSSLKAGAPVRCLVFTPTGKALASGGEDGSVTLWDLDGERSRLLGKHPKAVSGLAITHDGKRLVSAAPGRPLRGWGVATGQAASSLGDPAGEVVIAADPSADRVAVAEGTEVKLWATANQQVVATLAQFTTGVVSLAYSRDGARLAVATNNGAVS